jgi:glutathione S-transferase
MVLTVHHLHLSQSERVVFLCEELGVTYDLKIYDRVQVLAPPEYKALHPSGTAPTIQDDGLTLAESGACIEYICHKHAGGRLFPGLSDPAWPDFLYWWHWSNATFQGALSRNLILKAAGANDDNPMVSLLKDRQDQALAALDARLKDNDFLAGNEFTAADVMVMFTLTSFRFWHQYSLAGYDNVARYVKRVGDREGYKRAMEKSEPGLAPALDVEPPKPYGS